MARGLFVCLVLCVAIGALGAEPTPELEKEIAELEASLEAEPKNLEVRLELAYRLSWAGERARARRQAEIVIDAAPNDSDAKLLLARLDAWDGNYDLARAKLAEILSSDPRRKDALALATDVELWSESPADSIRAADRLVEVDKGADALFRRARAAALSMDPISARRWARRTLEADPAHGGARTLLRTTRYAIVSASSEFEVYDTAENSIALGQTIQGTLFPTGRWSVTAGYEYRRRFDTDNHLAAVSAAYRLTRRFSARALARAGSVKVVPEVTVGVGIVTRVLDYYSVGVDYRLDKMPWPGQLHRVIAEAGVGLPAGTELAANYFIGALRNCGNTDIAQGVTVRGRLSRGRLWAGARTGFGMELERAPLPPFLDEQFGDEVCDFFGETGLRLIDTRASNAGIDVGWSDVGRFELRAGYTYHYRHSGEKVHTSALTVRLWL